MFGFSHLARILGTQSARRTGEFVNALSSIGPLAAALSFHELPNPKRKELTVTLAGLCKRETKLDLPQSYGRRRTYELEDGLRKSAAVALSLGLTAEAQTISFRARHDRPGIWEYRDEFSRADVFSYIFRVALLATAKKQSIHEKDLLPKELVTICSRISKSATGTNFREKAREKLAKVPRKPRYEDEKAKQVPPNAMSDDEHQLAERFLSICLEPLLALAQALSATLAATSRTIDRRFVELVETWEQVRKNRDSYCTEDIDPFFHLLGLEAVLFVLWAPPRAKTSVDKAHAGDRICSHGKCQ